MSKYWKMSGAILIVTLIIIMAGVSITAAQDEPVAPVDPALPENPLPFRGGGRFGGSPMGQGLLSVDQAAMHEAIADTLGITVEALEEAIAEGQTLYSLAEQLGVDWAEVQASMQAIHNQALQTAVDEGLISQEQADWMGTRGQMGSRGGRFGGMQDGQFDAGPRGGARDGGMRGGRGW